MKKFVLVLLIVTTLAGCQSTLNLIMGSNRNYRFTSREAMAGHFNKKNKIDKETLYFFDDPAEQNAFIGDNLAGKTLGSFYALAVNDSLKMAEDPTANNWCPGVAATFAATTSSDSIMVTGLRSPHGLKGMKLSTAEGKQLNLNTPEPTIIFILHSAMGRAINGDSRYIRKQMEKDGRNVNYIYIALDRPSAVTES